MFTPHLHKIEQIKSDLKNARYDKAKRNIQMHLKAELKGSALLEELRAPINLYENSLRRISAELNTIEDPRAGNRLLVRDKCIGELEVARQQLENLHRKIEEIADVYFRK